MLHCNRRHCEGHYGADNGKKMSTTIKIKGNNRLIRSFSCSRNGRICPAYPPQHRRAGRSCGGMRCGPQTRDRHAHLRLGRQVVHALSRHFSRCRNIDFNKSCFAPVFTEPPGASVRRFRSKAVLQPRGRGDLTHSWRRRPALPRRRTAKGISPHVFPKLRAARPKIRPR